MNFIKQNAKFIFQLLIFLLISGCHAQKRPRKESPNYVIYADQVTARFMKEVKKEFGLDSFGSGGSMPNDIEALHVTFTTSKRVDIEKARELEVRLTEKFLHIINSHEKIRPFLRDYPFPPKRADITILFQDKPTKSQSKINIIRVYQSKNMIFYYIRDEKTGSKVLFKEEPYEEAYKMVQQKLAKENHSL